MNHNDFYWAFTPAKVLIYQSIHSSNLTWRAFWHTSRNFPAFWTSLKFGSLKLVKHFATFLISFSVWFFKIKHSTLCHVHIYWIPDLKSLKLVCFIVVNTWKPKDADSRLFWTWSCLSRTTIHVWKHFKYWLHEFF